jgi:predicted DNA repair protein MutK
MPSGFFALFDDIAVLMDDVTMSKIATKKPPEYSYDLAVNAEKASSFIKTVGLPFWKIGRVLC